MPKDIKQVIEKIDKIPTLPLVVTKLTDLIRNPRTSATDVQNVINKDPALSARVLKLVNSSFYGFSERISSVSHAIVILGFNTIKNIALTASVFDVFGKDNGGADDQFDREAFWLHSIAVAGTSRLIAKHFRLQNLEDIFVAGLLHDIGKIILDQYAHDQYEKVIQLVREKDMLIVEAEMQVLDLTHAQVGAWLATRWKLPQALVQMIGLHHKPELGNDLAKPVFTIHLADIFVRAMGIGSGGDSKIPKVSRQAWNDLEFDMDQAKKIMIQMEKELYDVEQFVKGI